MRLTRRAAARALGGGGALMVWFVLNIAPCGAATTGDSHSDLGARLEFTALLQTFGLQLLSGESATATLEHWCAVHRLAMPARITAEHPAASPPPLPPEAVRSDLQLRGGESVAYRHVRLRCGTYVLSEADNWYVPQRLRPEMLRELASTDEPFGKIVKPLHFARRTLSSEVLWHPLPEHWEMQDIEVLRRYALEPLAIPASVFKVRAVLVLPDGLPISEVIEIYHSNLLAFALPVVVE